MKVPPTDAQSGQGKRVVDIAELIKARAPNLRPNVAPRGPLNLAASNILSVCRTQAQQVEAQAYIENKLCGDRESSQSGGEGDKDEPTGEVMLSTEVDFVTRTFRICSAKLLETLRWMLQYSEPELESKIRTATATWELEVGGKVEATLRSLDRLMELHLKASPAQLEPYAKEFASANELAGNASAVPVLQDICSLSYALQVVATHMSGWTGYVGSEQLPISEEADMTEVLRELFGDPPPEISQAPDETPSKSPRKKGKPGSRSKSKAKSRARNSVKDSGDGAAGDDEISPKRAEKNTSEADDGAASAGKRKKRTPKKSQDGVKEHSKRKKPSSPSPRASAKKKAGQD